MATYYPGSNIQADAMHTLYLMNPSYAGCTDASASGNMVLVNHSAVNTFTSNNVADNGQPQHHLIGIPLPTVPLSQHPSVGAVANAPVSHQSVASSLLASRLGGHAYNAWRNGMNEVTFLQPTDALSNNQSLCGQLNNSVNLDHQSVAEASQFGPRQQLGMLPGRPNLHPDQSHDSTGRGHGQGLSLSLSPQQNSTIQLPSFQNQPTDSDVDCTGISQANLEENRSRADRSSNKWTGNVPSFRTSSRDEMLGNALPNTLYSSGTDKQMHPDFNLAGSAGLPNILTGSKYLKVAQQLLDEIVNVDKVTKPDLTRHQNSRIWNGAMGNKENTAEAGGKDGAMASTAATSLLSQETNNDHCTELTPAERQELQMKKAKLVAMLDEVDRRYRQYYHQMQIVVSSFEAAASFGAAKTYTALALQTISRHFRCLRDAITGQIRVTSKSLGEDDLTSGKGETSRLRFVDQQLRQQRALQQLGMIQQHAWRPQRGLPERSVSVLRAWLFEHFLHPYPKDSDKHMLARQTGLTRGQVSNWFINARVRLWKPMVEEMYLEETREVELDSHASAEKVSDVNGENKVPAGLKDAAGNSDNGQEQKHTKGTKEGRHEQQNDLKSDHASDLMNERNRALGMAGVPDVQVFHEVQKEGAIRQGQPKKARNGTPDSTALLSPNMSMDVDLKSEDTRSEDICDDSKFNDERSNTEDYTLFHDVMVHPDNSGTFGAYHIGGLSRYGQESFTPRFSGSGGVSLTLGLQHCDGLSLSGTQQSYISSQGLASGRRDDLGNDSDDYSNINETSAAHAANPYESINLQSKKHFSTHQLHDFVA
eukprot:Gb_22513 [translate_table: standard]